MNIPSVAAVHVGFYKRFDFFEFDCPHCGGTHTCSIRDTVQGPCTLRVPCERQHVSMTGFTLLKPDVTHLSKRDRRD